MKPLRISLAIAAVAIVAAVAAGHLPAAQAQAVDVSELASQTHIHGLAVDRQDSGYPLTATHHGLFRAGPDGAAERISVVQDFMGFNPHPSDPDTLYASGHPAEGGNLGFIASPDGGRTWEQISPRDGGPVDFHQMTVSAADPQTIYGAYGALQVPRRRQDLDGGGRAAGLASARDAAPPMRRPKAGCWSVGTAA